MAKYIYSNKVAEKRSLKSLTINSLMGVDYSSSMINIRDYHASDISNFIKVNNVLRNRNGYEQVGKSKINGIWECNYLGRKIIIAHIGNSICRVKDINTYNIYSKNYEVIKTDLANIKDSKSWGVFSNDRLYILCGKYYVIKFSLDKDNNVVFEAKLVFEDEDTYIPTTTIGITAVNSTLGIPRTQLDDINMMTRWRYNKANTYNGETWGRVFLLDGTPYFEYGNEVQIDENSSYQLISNFEITIRTNVVDNNTAVKLYAYKYNNTSAPSGSVIIHLYEEVFTSVDNKVGTINNNYISLQKDYENQSNSYDNVTIKFQVQSEDYKLIDNCTFGVIYGANGNRNRLFISGNSERPNLDFHTSQRNIYASDENEEMSKSLDYTYFSVNDYNEYGTSNSKVTDYQIMGNGQLMVLKEHNVNEPSIYFRNGTFITENDLVKETYPCWVGNIGVGTTNKSKGTLRNLNNDIVFVSNQGIYGVSSTIASSTLNSDYQYAFTRSSLINSRLKEYIEKSINITSIVYDNKYFVTFKLNSNEYKTMVADGRYPYKLPESIDNQYEYEWFVLDNIKADIYYIIDNMLYFTNDKGLFKLDLLSNVERHIDIDKYPIFYGEISQDDKIIISQTTKKLINDKTTFRLLDIDYQSDNNNDNDNVYVIGKTMINPNSNVFINDEKLTRDYLLDSTSIKYVKLTDSNNNITRKRCYVKELDYEYNEFYVYSDINMTELINLNDYIKCEFIFKANGNIFTFSNIDSDTKLIDIYGNEVTFEDNNENKIFYLVGELTTETIVECRYLTKAYNMGTSEYNKNLKSITVINDAENYSFVNFGIRTRNVLRRFNENISGGTKGIEETYQNIFKSDLTNYAFASSFTKNYYLKFNFIQFEFYNNNGDDCIINNINIMYTYGFKQGGIR